MIIYQGTRERASSELSQVAIESGAIGEIASEP